MADDDFQFYVLENTEIIDLPDGDAVVYPAGAVFGPAYRIPGDRAVAFYHWRLDRLSPSPARRWATRAAVFAGLLAAVFAGRAVAGGLPAVDVVVAFAALVVLTSAALAINVAQFRAAFPMARRHRDTGRLGRLTHAYICHPAFALWKCLAVGIVFAAAAGTLGRVLWLTAGSAGVQAGADLVAAGVVMAALLTLATVPLWLATRHFGFWRRHGHLPHLADVQSVPT